MLMSYVQRWLEIVQRAVQSSGWDTSLVMARQADDHTFVVQVRKSTLVFTVKQETLDPHHFGISYTAYSQYASHADTTRRLSAGNNRPGTYVERELEKWLHGSVAAYAALTELGD